MTTVTWNPSDKNASVTLSGGNLTASEPGTDQDRNVRATLGRSTGKRYFEGQVSGRSSTTGIILAGSSLTSQIGNGASDYGFFNAFSLRVKRNNGGGTSLGSYTYAPPPHVIGIAVDLDNHKVWFRFDGTWQEGDPVAGTSPSYSGFSSATYYPAWGSSDSNGEATSCVGHFTTASFVYAAPSGFLPWEDDPVSGPIATVESPDSAAIVAGVTTGAVLSGIESPDAATIATLTLMLAQIAGTEARDAAGLGAQIIATAQIAVTESSDRVAINRAARSQFVARRFGLLLYEPLPLRTSGALGNFAAEFVLAQRYGDLTSDRFKLERLDDKTFFAADHPMTIAELFVDNQEYKGWEQATRTDGAGHTWTVVVLAAPVPDGAALSATGTGKRNPRTGALIENPADIAEDIMRLAGRDDQWWDQLRAECGAAGLRLAGSLDEVLSIREWLDRVLGSAGAIWAPGMAQLYPVLTVSGFVIELDIQKAKNVVVSATLDNTADVLRLYYDPDKAGGNSQHYIELTANPKRYGGIATDLTFDWLRTPGNAESVGKRFLPWLAGERYNVAFNSSDERIRPGTWVKLTGTNGHRQWPFEGEDPYIKILEAVVNRATKEVSGVGQYLRATPAAIVTAHSVALPATRDASLEVAVADGLTRIVAKDPDGRPIAGARVNIDGGPAKTTGADGLAVFPSTPGEHRVAIQAPGMRAQILTIRT